MSNRIVARLEPQLNSYITVTNEAALADARRLDRSRGRRGALHGMESRVLLLHRRQLDCCG